MFENLDEKKKSTSIKGTGKKVLLVVLTDLSVLIVRSDV